MVRLIFKNFMICSKCKEEVPQEQFSRDRSRATGYSSRCKPCQRVMSNKHYADNKEVYKQRNYYRKEYIKKYIKEIKKNSECCVCGIRDHRVLQFHHREQSDKEFNISEAAGKKMSLDRLNKEIEKCDMMCANDHSILHYNEREDED